MPRRNEPITSDYFYHVYNRGVNKQIIFNVNANYLRMYETIKYYKYKQPISLSGFFQLSNKRKNEIITLQSLQKPRVSIVAYCLMPNHFHFVLKQNDERGIELFISDLENSYTKYFNLKYKKQSSLFINQFKAKRINTEEDLLHVSRYVHINPYTSYIVSNIEELILYPWSSLREYSDSYTGEKICDTDILLSIIDEPYIPFVLNNAEYQRELKKLKELKNSTPGFSLMSTPGVILRLKRPIIKQKIRSSNISYS